MEMLVIGMTLAGSAAGAFALQKATLALLFRLMAGSQAK
jgi:hypothetical protein